MDYIWSKLLPKYAEWRRVRYPDPFQVEAIFGFERDEMPFSTIVCVPSTLTPTTCSPEGLCVHGLDCVNIIYSIALLPLLPMVSLFTYYYPDGGSPRQVSGVQHKCCRGVARVGMAVTVLISVPSLCVTNCLAVGCMCCTEVVHNTVHKQCKRCVTTLESQETARQTGSLLREDEKLAQAVSKYPLSSELIIPQRKRKEGEDVVEEFERRLVVHNLFNYVVEIVDASTVVPMRVTKGGVYLDCPRLSQLTELVVEKGHLVLNQPLALRKVESIKVNGSVFIANAFDLESFGKNCEIRGGLYLRGAASLKSLGNNLIVGGDVDLSGCEIERLPPTFKQIKGNLRVTHCGKITELGSDLHTVKGDLNLTLCRSFERFGFERSLLIGGNLTLEGCELLTELPAGLLVQGKVVNLQMCKGLTSISEDFLKQFTSRVVFYVAGSGISESFVDSLGLRFPKVRFEFEQQSSIALDDGPLSTVSEVFFFFGSKEPNERIIEPAYVEPFLAFIRKVQESREFKNMKETIVLRVREVLDIMANDKVAREEMIVRIADSVDACHDKPIWTLNQMMVTCKIAHARGNLLEMRRLGLGVMRLGIVHKYAADLVSEDSDVDDVSIYLQMEILLREKLNLPVSAESMVYGASLPEDFIDEVCTAALSVDEFSPEFEAWLAGWDEWQRELRRDFCSVWTYEKLRGQVVEMNLDGQTNFCGEPLEDPVLFRGSVYSFEELMRRWVETGMDFVNVPIPDKETFWAEMQKVVSVSDGAKVEEAGVSVNHVDSRSSNRKSQRFSLSNGTTEVFRQSLRRVSESSGLGRILSSRSMDSRDIGTPRFSGEQAPTSHHEEMSRLSHSSSKEDGNAV